ncbi:hypothetical protein SDRG_02878 [Saprolegnia diclina VS20]|uniref:Uncharacterized protein n=1 Tax=Saprolegnia diclina (strain VS20) TaxID=1156394 RepID=T0R1L5_SAPDV|nr:hypothetical protein SDRG_02878 [Saprolegnia diclina VS20]EQC40230.1 hypothetical protein SDRG_02878 [Saprolegnia diclina VS20]|eukprot:XP_008606704.1 hypothetical protein SDRG_02878 [Saprolegnia diclina VS20]
MGNVCSGNLLGETFATAAAIVAVQGNYAALYDKNRPGVVTGYVMNASTFCLQNRNINQIAVTAKRVKKYLALRSRTRIYQFMM